MTNSTVSSSLPTPKTTAPATCVPVDGWSAVWEGYIRSSYDESHTLTVIHNDPMRLYCGDRLILDESNYGGYTKVTTGTVTLSSTEDKAIRIELFNTEGEDRIQLRWSSQSQRSEVVPITALYPSPWSTGSDVSITTGTSSLTSPAWVEGRVGADASSVSVDAGAGSFNAVRFNSTSFYADNGSAGGASYGVILNPDAATTVTVSTATDSASQTIDWAPIDVAAAGNHTVRIGDSLLFTATGGEIEIDPDYNSDNGFNPVVSGSSGSKFPRLFSICGTFEVKARIDGTTEIGPVTVEVIDVDWQGDSIACEIGYKRKKDIKAFGGDYHDIHVEAANPYILDFSYYYGGVAIKAKLKPIYSGTPVIHARLGKNGPLLASKEINEFAIGSQATKYISIVERYPDGSKLVSTFLEQMPWVQGLEVRLHIFIVGITFEDSTIDKTVYTDDFTLSGDRALCPYQMIMPPGSYTGACHTIKVYQSGTQIGDGN